MIALLVLVSFMSMQRLTHGRTGPDEGVLSLRRWDDMMERSRQRELVASAGQPASEALQLSLDLRHASIPYVADPRLTNFLSI